MKTFFLIFSFLAYGQTSLALGILTNKSRYFPNDRVRVQVTTKTPSKVKVTLKDPHSIILKSWELDIGNKGYADLSEKLEKKMAPGVYTLVVRDLQTKKRSMTTFRVGDPSPRDEAYVPPVDMADFNQQGN